MICWRGALHTVLYSLQCHEGKADESITIPEPCGLRWMMVEALAAVGLASSIITFINFSKGFGKLVRGISKGQGSLPKELEECHE
jgi:hypothetical protein